MRCNVVAEIMLTYRKTNFAFEYCKDFDGPKAYVRAGYSDNGAAQGASRLLQDVEVLEAIEERKGQLAAASRLNPEWILSQWMMIASANPDELSRVEVEPCDECWEIEVAGLPPNPACVTCKGKGISYVVITDTRLLKGAARRLYAGAVQTKDGIKILTRNQDEALKNLADYLGMLNKSKGELSGPGGGPIPLLHATPADLSDDQLLAIAASAGATLGVDAGVSSIPLLGTTIEAIV